MPGIGVPWRSTPSTAMPSALSASARRSTLPSDASPKSASSLSQERRTFIACLSELVDEADVVGEHLAEVVDAVVLLRHPVDAEAEREAAPLLRVESADGEDVGVHHPATTELQPRTVRATDVELGRRLGEREVTGPQAAG